MPSAGREARRWILCGHVQGVGFRPFVYRLAHGHGLQGWVQNRSGLVEILAQGRAEDLDAFGCDLLERAPPLARPQLLQVLGEALFPASGFSIRPSERSRDAHVFVPPDYFACADCLAELADPADRRYRYPFVNCTQCGPRYTLIVRLPYDRPNTTMAGFPLCPDCRAEYEDPLDRRFHAQPLACPVCGPRLRFERAGQDPLEDTGPALLGCVGALGQGAIVAVKGIGGYHLLCDAHNAESIERLRRRKPRAHKPLAVMFPIRGRSGLDAVRGEVDLSDEEAQLLLSPVRPIVLARAAAARTLPSSIAPGLGEIGVMLPYSPLHHLLLEDFGRPVVATSGNLSGEPVLTDADEARERLGHVADAFLHHNRPIERPADDPVYRSVGTGPRPLRLGRGSAPLEIEAPIPFPQPVLAVGAHMKNTVALGWEQRIVISPHIGDMGTARSLEVFRRVLADLQSLYGVTAEAVACDAHPGYATSRWARDSGLPLTRVYHHEAHASALVGDTYEEGEWLVFAWDGVGLGSDGTLWGGEALFGRPGRWERVGSLRPFRLPGGEKASREPWRSALGLCWEIGSEWTECPEDDALLRKAWERGVNSPQTSAAGRLFDGAAALTRLLDRASFEGQGPMLLEAAAAEEAGAPIELPVSQAGACYWVLDWAPLLPLLRDSSVPIGQRAAVFHSSLARGIVSLGERARQTLGVVNIGLCGGVFQNRRLVAETMALLEPRGFRVALPGRVPVNDASISFGQLIEHAALTALGKGGAGSADSSSRSLGT